MANRSLCENHGLWGSVGLGLADAEGALRLDLIDLENPSQEVVASDVRQSMHATEATGDDDGAALELLLTESPHVHTHTCFGRYGHCSRSPCHSLSLEYAREFGAQTAQRHLQAGTLLRIAMLVAGRPSAEEAAMYFLGVSCKKPLVQVLARAIPSTRQNGSYGLIPPQSSASAGSIPSTPEFATAHQVFHNLLQKHTCCGGEAAEVQFEVEIFAHVFPHHFSSVQKLEVSVLHVVSKFQICAGHAAAPKPARRPVELPFGLKPDKRQRKPQKRKKKQTPKRPAKKPKVLSQSQSQSCPDPDSDNDSDSTSPASSSSSGSSSTEVQCLDGDNDVDIDIDIEGSDEILMPPTEIARNEQESTKEECNAFLISQSKKLMAAERLSAPGTGSEPSKTQHGSFFVKEIGFEEGSIAPGGRAICYHCNKKIDKGTVRFAYFYSTKKPSRYIHQNCVIEFALADLTGARKQQTLHGMANILSAGDQSASSSSLPTPRDVKVAAERILVELVQQ